MLTTYRTSMDRLHDYLCHDPEQPIIEIHHSHIDHSKLFKARLISWIYLTAIYIWVLWEMPSITTNFIYLTLQGYFVAWLFYTAVLQDYWFIKIYGKENHPCKKFKHYIEIIYEIALCFQFPITLVFWGFLFPILLRNNASVKDIIVNTNLHLGPLVCLLVELYYNNFTFPKRHLWVAYLYGVGYMAINLIYSLSVKVIYEPIDWKSVLSYIITISCFAFVFGVHHFGGFSYRKWKAHKITNRITEGLIEEIEPKPRGSESTEQVKTASMKNNNPYLTKKDQQISNLISQGRKKDNAKRDNEILL